MIIVLSCWTQCINTSKKWKRKKEKSYKNARKSKISESTSNPLKPNPKLAELWKLSKEKGPSNKDQTLSLIMTSRWVILDLQIMKVWALKIIRRYLVKQSPQQATQ